MKHKRKRQNKLRMGGFFNKALPWSLIFLLFCLAFPHHSYAKVILLPVELHYSSPEEYKYLSNWIVDSIESRLSVPNAIIPRVGATQREGDWKVKIEVEFGRERALYRINLFKEKEVLFSVAEEAYPQEFILKFNVALDRTRMMLIEKGKETSSLKPGITEDQRPIEDKKGALKDRITIALSKLNPVPLIEKVLFKDKDRLSLKIDIPPPPPPPTQTISLQQPTQPQRKPQEHYPQKTPVFTPQTMPSSPSTSPWQWF